eukprot:scaffold58340_cov41-Attheya_sp.AAC.1
MSAQLVRLSNSLGSGRLAFTLAIDGTKVAQTKQISQKYKAIIGGSHPNHFITLDSLSDELAAEVKVDVIAVVMSCQRVPIGCSPYYVICGRPQTINEQSDFEDMVMKAAAQCFGTLQRQGTDELFPATNR